MNLFAAVLVLAVSASAWILDTIKPTTHGSKSATSKPTTSYITSTTCKAIIGTTLIRPEPIPIKSTTITMSTNITSTIGVPASTVWQDVIPVVQGPTLISTSTLTTTAEATPDYAMSHVTMDTFTIHKTFCPGLSQKATTTLWTGSYHRPSGAATPPNSVWTVAWDCTVFETMATVLTKSLRWSNMTVTSTVPIGPTSTLTARKNVTLTRTKPVSSTNETSVTASTYGVITTTTVTRNESCLQSTRTVKQNARCHPTNLADNIRGQGVSQVSLADISMFGQALDDPVDASECCQICVDNKRCTAMVSDTSTGFCVLYFSSDMCRNGTDSGVFLTYDASPGFPIQAGLAIQEGCAKISAGSSSPSVQGLSASRTGLEAAFPSVL